MYFCEVNAFNALIVLFNTTICGCTARGYQLRTVHLKKDGISDPVVHMEGLEPPTHGLKIRYSTS